MTHADLEPGLSGSAHLVVTEDDTAEALLSGDVPVLATPRIVALAEEATCAAVARALGPGETTLGVRIELDHSKATVVGDSATADALLSDVDGRRLVFEVVVRDGSGQIASGTIERVVVDRERFLSGLP